MSNLLSAWFADNGVDIQHIQKNIKEKTRRETRLVLANQAANTFVEDKKSKVYAPTLLEISYAMGIDPGLGDILEEHDADPRTEETTAFFVLCLASVP